MISSQSRSNSIVTHSLVRNKEFERERKSIVDIRRTEQEFSLMEKRLNDKAKWKSRAEKHNLMKDVHNVDKPLTPSVDEWLQKNALKQKIAKRPH